MAQPRAREIAALRRAVQQALRRWRRRADPIAAPDLGPLADDLRTALAHAIEIVASDASARAVRSITKARAPTARQREVARVARAKIDRWRGQYVVAEVERLTVSTRAGVARVLAESARQGWSADVTARRLKPLLGLNARQAGQALRYQVGLINRGVPLRMIDRRVAAFADRQMAKRASVIADQAARRAAHMGEVLTWQTGQEQGVIRTTAQRRWVTEDDDAVCPICVPMDGVEVGLEELFLTSVGAVLVPNEVHLVCRCDTVLVGA